jgi:hypothetical protein
MTGNLGITYGYGPVQFLGMMQFPLAYLNKRSTKLSTEEGDILFDSHFRNVWQVQEPIAFRILLVCALGNQVHP